MKLNLGCGKDVKDGYVNVDLFVPENLGVRDFEQRDLSRFPWPWEDKSADEIIMLDFLEHFPYAQTSKILSECWRVLKSDGKLDVQVPDFRACSRAITHDEMFQCNRCGEWMDSDDFGCPGPGCKQSVADIQDAAIHRLYGGQDRTGNWHHTTFTGNVLKRHLEAAGFHNIVELQRNENNETYAQNWNVKVSARKKNDLWGD